MSDGKKYDTGKAPVVQGCFQYFPRALKAVAMVSKYGAEKYNLDYSDVNWARVLNGSARYTDAGGRHLLDRYIDPSGYDPESHLLHVAMEAWNALAKLELELKNGTPLHDPEVVK